MTMRLFTGICVSIATVLWGTLIIAEANNMTQTMQTAQVGLAIIFSLFVSGLFCWALNKYG